MLFALILDWPSPLQSPIESVNSGSSRVIGQKAVLLCPQRYKPWAVLEHTSPFKATSLASATPATLHKPAGPYFSLQARDR